jgi:hypothetical protein
MSLAMSQTLGPCNASQARCGLRPVIGHQGGPRRSQRHRFRWSF